MLSGGTYKGRSLWMLTKGMCRWMWICSIRGMLYIKLTAAEGKALYCYVFCDINRFHNVNWTTWWWSAFLKTWVQLQWKLVIVITLIRYNKWCWPVANPVIGCYSFRQNRQHRILNFVLDYQNVCHSNCQFNYVMSWWSGMNICFYFSKYAYISIRRVEAHDEYNISAFYFFELKHFMAICDYRFNNTSNFSCICQIIN